MERKTHFESEADVEGYFAAQMELWDEPRPKPPRYLWERIEQVRLNVKRPVKANHRIAKPNFAGLQFPKISKQRSTYRVKTIHKIPEVPRMRASPQRRYRLNKISSLRDLILRDFPRLDET
jgi:hypothetical protein